MARRNTKPFLAISLVLLLGMSGCTGLFDSDEPYEMVPTDLGDVAKRSIGSPNLEIFSDCDELEIALKQSIEEEARTSLLQAVDEVYYWGGGIWLEGDAEMAMDDAGSATSSTPPPTTRQEGVDYSGTNNQEQGVDEADFVKTNGYNIFFVDNGVLHIMDVPEFGQIEHASTTDIQGSPVAMMLNEDNLVVVSTVYNWNIDYDDPLQEAMGWSDDWYGWRTNTLTKFTVFDISNSSSPEVNRELYIEGYYMTAREVAGTVRTVTHTWMNIPDLRTWISYPDDYWTVDYSEEERRNMREVAAQEAMEHNQQVMSEISLEDILPQVHERIGSEIITHHMDGDDCSDFAAPEDALNRGYTSIFTIDLISEELDFEADHIVGNWPLVYSSQDTLIITENAWDWWWFWGHDDLMESTNIHTFDISQPGETTYAGSGRVDGTILDQFSISEYEGVVRVATTTGQWGRWWMENPTPMENHVITLSHALDVDTGKTRLLEMGRVDGIAYNETIWSARFVEDRAYIVTFENMDPLWTIDLSNPTSPTIMGELKVPGVSTYIHPLSDDAILTIGLGPADEETGLGLDWSNTRLSLFNVSNFSDPQETQTLSLSPVEDPTDGWAWAWSEATWEHKAFQYWAPKGMLAVPLNTYRYDYYYDENGHYHYEYDWVSKLMIVNITEEGMELHGEVDHSQFYDTEEYHWWSSYNIRRSIFMGDYIYAISHAGITVTHLDTLEEVDALQLVQVEPYDSEVATSEGTEEEDKSEG
jgi:uncharacterized secreted protein with C-terminal beta-propeller domain|tara:strand:- start:392 stop:2662 length:2271 start_codon:yes stop_codon:yes gene_type:complete